MPTVTLNDILEKRVENSTRRNYDSYLKKFKRWLENNSPESLRENEIIVPLPNEAVILQFLDQSKTKQQQRRNARDQVEEVDEEDDEDDEANQEQPNQSYIAYPTMVGMSSAIQDLYRSQKKMVNQEIHTELKMFLRGYKRFIQDRKQAGVHPIHEGKRHLTFVGYVSLAKYAIRQQESRDSSLFAHTFLVLCWNLFARSHSVSTLMLQHISWDNDAMVVTLPKHKGDQEGSRVYPKHVYANPYLPEICPILSLAIYTFSTNSFHRNGSDWMVFQGGNQETKFSHWLVNALKRDDVHELAELHAIAKELGTHSLR